MASAQTKGSWTGGGNLARVVRAALVAGTVLAAVSIAPQIAAGGGAAGPVPTHAQLTVRSSPYGKILFDPRGRVLYLFAADRTSKSTCYGVCAKAWPPLLTRAKPLVRAGLRSGLLGTTRRRDGSLQVTYNRHPLYYFVEDKPHEIMCQHADMHGGFWFVVKPNGTANTAKSKTPHM